MVTVQAENEVEAEILGEELDTMKEKRQRIQTELGKIADQLESGEELTLNDGTVVSPEELEGYATRRIGELETLNEKILLKEETFNIYNQNATTASERREEAHTLVTQLEAQMELIDAQIANLRIYEAQPELLTEGGDHVDALARAKELVDEMQKTVSKERLLREKSSEIAETSDLDQRIEESLSADGESGGNSDLISTLRSLSEEGEGE